ncbi:MaoC/PaaZ C-terminal domain-containing protein [Stackebrandtia nassauensis]|uniref:MaoC domain protein dehydratase n=1 Tax=Stackebrandtia nassauensis (strain DSM 44728 / CIP 108903 / NRRL B-16338 / NBRC 102104 / LLR-40K-21) TaxID=446470 RepID=D3Q807_STANL|nr:MaoC/PaaZ C-terminal domain-containing protein [Stackebrandtia nassauensis]ADD40512.1 MaoC domain protein dehydratase [Stackebrandtia nassauensis DSM 44728]
MWRSGTGETATIFYEDFTIGREFDLGSTTVDDTEMRGFAGRFDPQWYHLDDELAAAGSFGAVTASGWFTASLFMRMYTDAVLSRAAADASPGLEELRWLAPVYAGDELTGRLTVLDRSPSQSRPGLGTVKLSGVLAAANRETAVLSMRFRGWFGMRGPQRT